MNQSAQPLIVGAGPVGKAAALVLAREGIPTRIIDSAEQPSEHSKALAVNPRTLEILELDWNHGEDAENWPSHPGGAVSVCG